MINWNYKNGIRIMRMSSEMMPHYTNPKTKSYSYDFVKKDLEDIGRLSRLYKQRLTFHPGQYNILSTKNENVFQMTKNDLEWHSSVMDTMNLDQDSVIVIHGGGIYDNKEEAIQRFIKNFYRLNESTQKRLVLENCEKCYNIIDVMGVCCNTKF